MLTITSDAADAIEQMTEQLELPDSAGLRISVAPVTSDDGSGPELIFELTNRPDQGDEVVEAGTTQVFLAPVASQALEGKRLEYRAEPSGEPTFAIADET